MLEDLSPEEIKEQFKKNKTLQTVAYVVGGLLILVLGYFAYKQFIWKPANEKSKDAYWEALNYVKKDSIDLAIEQLNVAVKKYDGKIGGEVSQFVLARQYMNKKDFKKALDLLEDVDVEDTYVQAMAVGLQGDCYSEMEKYEEASELYLKASKINPNEVTTPMYLFKAGQHLEEIKNFEKAAECYKQIKKDYPTFASQKTIEKYIVRAENQTTK